MASSSSNFELSSTKTALVITVPVQSSADVNALRSVHDRSFFSWPPHLNIIYPFVDPESLPNALEVLQKALQTWSRPLNVKMQETDVFRHRHNATIFIKPADDTRARLEQLRGVLVRSLDRGENEGTIEGEFRPHLTIGQASMQGDAVDVLLGLAKRMQVAPWECSALAVLKRNDAGEMGQVAELPFGAGKHKHFRISERSCFPDRFAGHPIITKSIDWSTCFSYDPVDKWALRSHMHRSYIETPASFQISTWNLMSETFAPPLEIRLPLIIAEIKKIFAASKAYLKVLCFQEVNELMLEALLNDFFILSNFRYSSHRPGSVLASERNLLTLASAPFSYQTIYFAERHKSALAAIFYDLDLVTINVHLTSGLSSEAVAVRAGQMQRLHDFLWEVANWNQEIDAVLTGDFNIATSSLSIDAALHDGTVTGDTVYDLRNTVSSHGWEDVFDVSTIRVGFEDRTQELAEGEDGATFDPVNNRLAAMSSRMTSNRPQRYDRILKSTGMMVKVERFERFGLEPVGDNFASDHYGLSATIKYGGGNEEPPPAEDSLEETVATLRLDANVDSVDVSQLLLSLLPNEENKRQREEAIEMLRRMLNSDSRLSNLLLVPLGSYAMGTFFPDSDVDMLAIGPLSSKTFFDVATARLKLISGDDGSSSEGNGLRAVHLVNSLVPIVEASLNNVKFDIQYCSAPELLEIYRAPGTRIAIEKLIFDNSVISRLSPASLRPLNTYRDTISLLNAVPDLPPYRTAHRFLALYLKRRGLYSAKFGYLGGIHLSLLLAHVLKSLPAPKGTNKLSAASLIYTFFAYYANFDWQSRIVADANIEWHRSYTRSAREPVVVLSLHAPTARPNVAASCTRLSAAVISAEFKLAAAKLEDGGIDGWKWCLRPQEQVASEFLQAWGAFVRIKIDIWNIVRSEREKAREIVGGIESKITLLMVSLGKIVGFGLRAQVWPARFKLREDNADDTGISGFYLVGVSAKDEALSLEQKKSLQGKVLGAVRNFESEVRASTLLKDVQNVWLEVDVVSKKKISELDVVLDH